MTTHGNRTAEGTKKLSGAAILDFARTAESPYRNFGKQTRETNSAKIYSGLNDPQRTEAMFAKLMKRMSLPFQYADGAYSSDGHNENPDVPSGYTYLAQFVGHDMTLNTVFPGKLTRVGTRAANRRMRSLMLDTLYGGGPLVDEASFELPRNNETHRTRLRTSKIDGSQVDIHHLEPPGCPFLNRDIPRALQNDLSDEPKFGRPDALVPDRRNDDSVMVSQLTALFHLFHNAVLDRIRSFAPEFGEQDPAPRDIKLFETARALVTQCYRDIVKSDLLPRILSRDVYAAYKGNGLLPIVERDPAFGDAVVPLEFSHAAFRACHSMVRLSYQFNDAHDPQGLISALLRSSSSDPKFFPLKANWISQWSNFFELGGGKVPQKARRFGPTYNDVLLLFSQFSSATDTNDIDPNRSGLLFRDMVRGTVEGVLRLNDFVGLIPDSIKGSTVSLIDSGARAAELRAWLTDSFTEFQTDELQSLSEDPPLLFWILYEAAQSQGGLRLGVSGSTVVAEAILGGMQDEIKPPMLKSAFTELYAHVFLGRAPKTMPELVRFVSSTLKLHDATPRFV